MTLYPVVPVRAEETNDPCIPSRRERFEKTTLRAEQEYADIGGLKPAQVGVVLDDAEVAFLTSSVSFRHITVPVWDMPKGEYPAGDIGRWAGDDFDADQGRPRYKLPSNFPKQRDLFGLNEPPDGTDAQPLIVVEGVFGALRPSTASPPS